MNKPSENEAFLRTMWSPGRNIANGLGSIDEGGVYREAPGLTMTRTDGSRVHIDDLHPEGVELDRPQDRGLWSTVRRLFQ